MDAKSNFAMVKQRHSSTFKDALEKGLVDKALAELCAHIAGTKNYFTSSGCAGRILLIGVPESGLKKDAYFHRKWHEGVGASAVWSALGENTTGWVWLKMEGFILHIGCADLEGCKKVLAGMKECGIKRGGIMVAKEGKFIVEVESTQRMSLPVKDAGNVLVSEGYLQVVVEKANAKMRRNSAMLGRFSEWCMKNLE